MRCIPLPSNSTSRRSVSVRSTVGRIRTKTLGSSTNFSKLGRSVIRSAVRKYVPVPNPPQRYLGNGNTPAATHTRQKERPPPVSSVKLTSPVPGTPPPTLDDSGSVAGGTGNSPDRLSPITVDETASVDVLPWEATKKESSPPPSMPTLARPSSIAAPPSSISANEPTPPPPPAAAAAAENRSTRSSGRIRSGSADMSVSQSVCNSTAELTTVSSGTNASAWSAQSTVSVRLSAASASNATTNTDTFSFSPNTLSYVCVSSSAGGVVAFDDDDIVPPPSPVHTCRTAITSRAISSTGSSFSTSCDARGGSTTDSTSCAPDGTEDRTSGNGTKAKGGGGGVSGSSSSREIGVSSDNNGNVYDDDTTDPNDSRQKDILKIVDESIDSIVETSSSSGTSNDTDVSSSIFGGREEEQPEQEEVDDDKGSGLLQWLRDSDTASLLDADLAHAQKNEPLTVVPPVGDPDAPVDVGTEKEGEQSLLGGDVNGDGCFEEGGGGSNAEFVEEESFATPPDPPEGGDWNESFNCSIAVSAVVDAAAGHNNEHRATANAGEDPPERTTAIEEEEDDDDDDEETVSSCPSSWTWSKSADPNQARSHLQLTSDGRAHLQVPLTGRHDYAHSVLLRSFGDGGGRLSSKLEPEGGSDAEERGDVVRRSGRFGHPDSGDCFVVGDDHHGKDDNDNDKDKDGDTTASF